MTNHTCAAPRRSAFSHRSVNGIDMYFQCDAKDMVCNISFGWPGVRSARRPIDLQAGTTAILCERVLRALPVIMRPETRQRLGRFFAFSTIEMGTFARRVHVYVRNSAMLISLPRKPRFHQRVFPKCSYQRFTSGVARRNLWPLIVHDSMIT